AAPGSCHRQCHLERRALSRARAFNRDPPTVQIDDTLDDRKAEAGRAFARGRLRRKPLETAEQSGNIFRRKACPLVADLNQYTAVLLSDQEVDGSAERAILDGVAYEIVDCLADAVRIAHGDMICRRGDRDGLLLARGERAVCLRHFL